MRRSSRTFSGSILILLDGLPREPRGRILRFAGRVHPKFREIVRHDLRRMRRRCGAMGRENLPSLSLAQNDDNNEERASAGPERNSAVRVDRHPSSHSRGESLYGSSPPPSSPRGPAHRGGPSPPFVRRRSAVCRRCGQGPSPARRRWRGPLTGCVPTAPRVGTIARIQWSLPAVRAIVRDAARRAVH